MNVSVENVGNCKKRLRVEVPAERVKAVFEQVVREFQKAAKLPGFRPGKIPRHLLLKTYGQRVDAEAIEKVITEGYRAALDEAKLRPVGSPKVENGPLVRDADFSFTVTTEVVPEFPLPNYKGLQAKRPISLVTEEDVERALEILRQRQVTFNDLERPAEAGDVVVLDYEATSDGKPLSDYAPTARGLTRKEDQWILIEPGAFLPGFTEPLVGVSAGDKRTVTVRLPEDRVPAELAGREAVFEVTVKAVKERVLPAIDDAFAGMYGAEDLQTLTESVRRDLQREKQFRQKETVRNQLLSAIVSQVNMELPEELLAEQTRRYVYEMVHENQERGVPKETIEEKKDDIYKAAAEAARGRLKLTFVLGEIGRAENIEIKREEVVQRVLAMARQEGVSPEAMMKTLKEQGRIPSVEQEVFQIKVMDLIELNARIEEVLSEPDPAPPPAGTPA